MCGKPRRYRTFGTNHAAPATQRSRTFGANLGNGGRFREIWRKSRAPHTQRSPTFGTNVGLRVSVRQAETSSCADWPAAERTARFTADTTALNDAVVVSASMPTPQRRWPSTSTST
ncbi:hypothetical protein AXZ95_2032 [Leifsonia sp. 115AMFTsu3.1]|nr:hypothetical protein AXZ95_2032 [Leifsonia sp. 115AMFTsu3.1]